MQDSLDIQIMNLPMVMNMMEFVDSLYNTTHVMIRAAWRILYITLDYSSPAILYSTLLLYDIFYITILCYIILCYTILYYTMLHYTTLLYYTTLCCTISLYTIYYLQERKLELVDGYVTSKQLVEEHILQQEYHHIVQVQSSIYDLSFIICMLYCE